MKGFEKYVLKRVFKRLRARFEDVCENVRQRSLEMRL